MMTERSIKHNEGLPLESYEAIESLEDVSDFSSTDSPDNKAGAHHLPASSSRACVTPKISLLVTARNYDEFLGDCLHSCLAQTLKPCEIIYLDDGSDDNSVAVARTFEQHGVKVFARSHRGVVAGRNETAEKATGDYLLFVDGDNILPPDYLYHLYDSLDHEHGFAYASRQMFGDSRHLADAPEFDPIALWQENYIDTCSLIRRDIFEACGRWRETPQNTYWDWDLFLRATRFTRGVRSPARLWYRRHSQNWSRQILQTLGSREKFLKRDLRKHTVNTIVCCAYSGRVDQLFSEWIEAVEASLQFLRYDQRELFIIDDSPEGFWNAPGADQGRLMSIFRSVRVDRVHAGTRAQERRQDRTATARWLSNIYNRFLHETSAEVLFFVEDDILIPENAGSALMDLLLEGDVPKAAVTGYYRSRFEAAWVASHTNGRRVVHATEIPATPQAYDLTGTGCLMVFRPMAPVEFRPDWIVPEHQQVVHAHDWVFSWRLKELGRPVIAHPRVVCQHALSETELI